MSARQRGASPHPHGVHATTPKSACCCSVVAGAPPCTAPGEAQPVPWVFTAGAAFGERL